MEFASIKMKTTDAGPKGTKHQGKVYTVTSEEAEELVNGNFAEYEKAVVKNPVPFVPEAEKAVIKPPETADRGKDKVTPEKAAVKEPNKPWGKA